MSFLQPLMLLAAPLMALPIIIHLINQRRYQTMRWGAMRFLLTANRMSRGYARIRQWLILACRTLAIAGLIFAACRPLASGFLGLISGDRADTTIILLDRSPSMSQRGGGTPQTKLDAGVSQLVSTLEKLDSSHWVLIESDRNTPRELDSIDTLKKLPEARCSSKTADLPKLLEAAAKYVENNKTGRTEVWICSDLRENDWRRRSAEWQQLRDKFIALPQGIRFHLFAYPQTASDNIAVTVTEVQRLAGESSNELSVSLRISREQATAEPIAIPIQFEIAGARSQTSVELTAKEFELRGHRIPIDSQLERGWGRVSIPADSNSVDNEFYFTFEKPQPRRAILVLEDLQQAAPLQFAAEVPPSSSVVCEAQAIEQGQLDGVAWEEVSLVVWQAPLPEAATAKLLETYVARGGQVLFLPPESPGAQTFRGVSWEPWQTSADPVQITTWRMDQDLLANSIGGISLPVGELETYRHCPARGEELTSLATLAGGDPLVSRLATSSGGVYFCGTTTSVTNSSLANNGVVLYVAVQRALANGAAVLGHARQIIAGREAGRTTDWKPLAGASDAISTEYQFHGGVYESNQQLLAVNRAADQEDHASVLSDEHVNGLFEGLDFSMVQSEVGTAASLVREIWRAFLLAMIFALLAEAMLCVPRAINSQTDKNSIFRERQERDAIVKEMQGAA